MATAKSTETVNEDISVMSEDNSQEGVQTMATTDFDSGVYCDFTASSAKAVAGKDILLAVFNADGTKLMAVSGQKGLTINRSADSIEVTSKDTEGGWKAKISGMKEWSIDNDGLYVMDDDSHKALGAAFDAGDPVCLKVINGKTKQGMFGGLAYITDYPIEAPYDDAMTYSLTFDGNGKLVDLTALSTEDAAKVTTNPA